NACVYVSNNAVSDGTKTTLQKAATRLADVKEYQRDWHPGSDGKMLDQVHPSLVPHVCGRSSMVPTVTVTLKSC
ncbi:hypothetical protein DOTSEDRAFT_98584, partial [Dothistroma septosporum NZE10]